MRIPASFFLILACIAIIHVSGEFPIGQVSSATYYVSSEGDNGNSGTYSSPWATPGFASKQLHAGDILIVLGGRYILSEFYEDMITPLNSGNSGAWITIKGEEGNTPVLAGKDNLYSAIELDAAHVFVQIHTATGQLLRILNLGYKPIGFYITREKAAYWDGRDETCEAMASGVYFYTIHAGEFTDTKKMILTR